jgi:hypothetical protein
MPPRRSSQLAQKERQSSDFLRGMGDYAEKPLPRANLSPRSLLTVPLRRSPATSGW